jgi:Flp pilus assembly protein TadD
MRKKRQKREPADAIQRSRALLVSGRHEANFDHLRTSVEKFPGDPEIRLLYATVLLEYGPEEVAAEAVTAAELGRDSPPIIVGAAQLMLNRGEVEDARTWLARANELAPADFTLGASLMNLNGLIAALDGEDELAEERLRSALRSEPDNGPFAIDLARFLVSRERRDEAVEIVDQTLMRTDGRENLERFRAEIAP